MRPSIATLSMLVAAFFASGLDARGDETATCATAAACVASLRAEALANDTLGIGPRERRQVERVVPFGAAAVVPLLPLLEDENENVGRAAAYALEQLGPAARAAIPALGRALERRLGFAAGALEKTGDPAAVPFLVAGALAGDSGAAGALVGIGPLGWRAVPGVVAKTNRADAIAERLVGSVRSTKGDRARLASSLAAVAKDEAIAASNRALACRILGALGAAATPALPVLRALAKQGDGVVAAAARGARVEIGDRTQLRELVAQLEKASDEDAPHAAERLLPLGVAAAAATPALVERAKGASWDRAPKLVEDLGSIGDARAVPFLVASLSSPNWRLVEAAADALGRMGLVARPALGPLEGVEKHWYPHAAAAAVKARAAIEDGTPNQPRLGAEAGIFGVLKVVDVPGQLSSPALPPACRPVGGNDWLLAIDVDVALPAELGHLGRHLPGRFARHVVEDGDLWGTDLGRHGGQVVWVGAGREEKVVDGNVFAFVQRPFGLVLLQGLADLMDDHGRVSVLERGTDGHWIARSWLELPAQPYAYRALPAGGLVIATRGGTVTLGPDGAVTGYDCVPFRRR